MLRGPKKNASKQGDRRQEPAVFRVSRTREPAPPTPAEYGEYQGSAASRESGDGTDCIVATRNYGRFLAECLSSLLRQGYPFRQIVVVDDDSEDDTAEVVQAFAAQGVRYVRVNHHHPSASRNAGVAAADRLGGRADRLLFVDADNILPPDYHERLLQALHTNPQVGWAYPSMMRFDSDTGRHLGLGGGPAPFSLETLRRNNLCDTCSLIRRDVFDQVGGFRPSEGFHEDWSFFLTASRYGWRGVFAEKAQLLYRVHSGQRCQTDGVRTGVSATDCLKHSCLLSVVTLFSGRGWCLEQYLRGLDALDWPRSGFHLVAVDNSCDPAFGARLRARLGELGISFSYVPDRKRVLAETASADFTDSRDLRIAHNHALSVQMARLYGVARAHLPGGADFILCLEDDVEIPPRGATALLHTLSQHSRAGVAAGLLVSRFDAGSALLAWQETGDGSFAQVVQAPPAAGLLEVGASGFYCTMFRRATWDRLTFHPMPGAGQRAAYDWAAGRDVRSGGESWLLCGAVRCRHWQRDGSCLDV